jgi:hypothetical protein
LVGRLCRYKADVDQVAVIVRGFMSTHASVGDFSGRHGQYWW